MRALQEEGERCTLRSRTIAARLLSTKAQSIASQDEVTKLRGQLRRAREQVAENIEARIGLDEELRICAAAFSHAVSDEAEAHMGMRQEVDQLTHVTEDLERRLREKAIDIEKAREANAKAAKTVAAMLEQWRTGRAAQVAAVDCGPLGECLTVLRAVAAGRQQPSGAPQSPSLPREAQPEDVPDLPALRRRVGRKEEQLAGLHRKIRFLTEAEL